IEVTKINFRRSVKVHMCFPSELTSCLRHLCKNRVNQVRIRRNARSRDKAPIIKGMLIVSNIKHFVVIMMNTFLSNMSSETTCVLISKHFTS
ncbi:hypothetical protein L9F63_000977, partial [Diploptera punctata]